MNASPPRETFIALRARREGYQIALEILNPPMEVPEFRREVLPADRVICSGNPEFIPPRRYDTMHRDISIALLGILLSSTAIALLWFLTH